MKKREAKATYCGGETQCQREALPPRAKKPGVPGRGVQSEARPGEDACPAPPPTWAKLTGHLSRLRAPSEEAQGGKKLWQRLLYFHKCLSFPRGCTARRHLPGFLGAAGVTRLGPGPVDGARKGCALMTGLALRTFLLNPPGPLSSPSCQLHADVLGASRVTART